AVRVLGTTGGALGGSAYWAEVLDFVGGQPAPVDLRAERRLQQLLVAAAQRRLLRSAHDCAEGGLLVALAEAAIGAPYAADGVGLTADLSGHAPAVALDGLLFGEDGARAVVSCAPEHAEVLEALAREHGVPVYRAGTVGAPAGRLQVRAGGETLAWSVSALRQVYFQAIPRRMRQPDADRAAGA
ncbi:MAG: AIR synthase-related protein, partial [Gemmatimonadales bacterium]